MEKIQIVILLNSKNKRKCINIKVMTLLISRFILCKNFTILFNFKRGIR